MNIGFWEIVLIVAIALIALGPERIPVLMKGIARLIREVRSARAELEEELYRSVEKEEKGPPLHTTEPPSSHLPPIPENFGKPKQVVEKESIPSG
jgi:Tat protein translocase TatB subunit